MILIHRLHFTFQLTSYHLSRNTVVLLIVAMLLQSTFMITYCVLLYQQEVTTVKEIWFKVLGAISALIYVLDISINLFLFTLFIRKLRQLMMTRMKMQSMERRISHTKSEQSNAKLLDVIIKQTIIGTSITFCSFGFMMTTAVGEAFMKNEKHARIITYWVSYCARGIEGVVILVLLYIGLSVNDTAYRKFCGKCHRNCYDFAERNFQKRIDKNYCLMEDLQMESPQEISQIRR